MNRIIVTLLLVIFLVAGCVEPSQKATSDEGAGHQDFRGFDSDAIENQSAHRPRNGENEGANDGAGQGKLDSNQSLAKIDEIGPEFVRFTIFNQTSYRLTAHETLIATDGPVEGRLEIAPLSPNTDYVLGLGCPKTEANCALELPFTTPDNPYHWNRSTLAEIQPGGGLGWMSPINVAAVLTEPSNESV